jgi:hypothetical protein
MSMAFLNVSIVTGIRVCVSVPFAARGFRLWKEVPDWGAVCAAGFGWYWFVWVHVGVGVRVLEGGWRGTRSGAGSADGVFGVEGGQIGVGEDDEGVLVW